MAYKISTKTKQNQRKRLFEEQGGRCYYCSTIMLLAKIPNGVRQPSNLATLDHIIPVSKGGACGPTLNCILACRSCNNERGDQDARDFLFKKMGVA